MNPNIQAEAVEWFRENIVQVLEWPSKSTVLIRLIKFGKALKLLTD